MSRSSPLTRSTRPGLRWRTARPTRTEQSCGARIRQAHRERQVRRIKFHGLRHAAAILALLDGVPAKTVQTRLGHKRLEITMNIYAHVLESAQKAAAVRIGSILHRREEGQLCVQVPVAAAPFQTLFNRFIRDP
ncbi:MAG: tyrosine-type recombinase/integrase [Vicinamibacteria bacterium]